MSQYPSENVPGEDTRSSKPTAKEIFTSPAFFIIVGILVVGIWFGSSFLIAASNPTKEDSINYYGVAEVVTVSETPRKCFVHIRREDGSVTKQSMARASCRQLREGDVINVENGQYVSKRR